jgi:thioredoxin 1
MSNAIDISDDNFDSEVLESDKPVLIDFWAEWCGPCKVLGPVIDEVSVDYSDKVKFVKLNIDNNPSNTQKYGIRGIPTLLLFKNGEKVDTSVGVLSKSELASFIDKNL